MLIRRKFKETLGNWEKQSYILKPDKKLSAKLISERRERKLFSLSALAGFNFHL